MKDLEKIHLKVVQMLNYTNDEHVKLLNSISVVGPASEAQIIENLSAVHRAKVNVLNEIIGAIRELKSGK